MKKLFLLSLFSLFVLYCQATLNITLLSSNNVQACQSNSISYKIVNNGPATDVIFQIDIDPSLMTLSNVRVNASPVITANTTPGYTDFPLGVMQPGAFVNLTFELFGCSWITTAGSTRDQHFLAIDNLLSPIALNVSLMTFTVVGSPKIIVSTNQLPIQQISHSNQNLTRIITYRNDGSAPFTGTIEFVDNNCYDISITSVSVQIGANTYPTQPGFIFDFSSHPIISNTEFSVIEIIHINNIVCTPCTLPGNPAAQNEFILNWGCGPARCHQTPFSSISLTRGPERPALVGSRTTQPGCDAVWESTCTGSTTHWEYVFENTGNDPMYNVNITLGTLSAVHVYAYIPQSSIQLTTTANITSQNPVLLPHTTHCSANVPDAIANYTATLDVLMPGQTCTLSYNTFRCCPDDVNLFDGPKAFNHWILYVQGDDECCLTQRCYIAGNRPGSRPVFANDGGKELGFENFDNSSVDIDLVQGFTPFVNHMEGSTAPAGGCDQIEHFEIRNNQFMTSGSDFDFQFFATNTVCPPSLATITTPLHGRIRIEFRADQGLVVFPASINIQNTNIPPIWNPSLVTPNGQGFDAFFDLSHFANLADFRDWFRGSVIHFDLQACCPTPLPVSNYTVSTYITPNPTGTCATCWIPLDRVNSHIAVGCPACNIPGIEPISFDLNRITLGLIDANNNGVADGPNPPPNPQTHYSYAGDVLRGRLEAFFEDGITFHGYTYADWRRCHNNARLTNLYLDQKITNGGSAGVNLNIITASLEIRRGGTLFGPPITLIQGTEYNATTTNDIFSFDLSIANIHNRAGYGTYQYEVNDNFVIRTEYMECQNFSPTDPLHPMPAYELIGEVINGLYLTGTTQAPGCFFTTCVPACSIWNITPVCILQTPDLMYYHGSSGCYNYFYSIETLNQQAWNDNSTCTKQAIIAAEIRVGGPFAVNVFPFEVRSPQTLPTSIDFYLPPGYRITNAVAQTELHTYDPWPAPFPFQPQRFILNTFPNYNPLTNNTFNLIPFYRNVSQPDIGLPNPVPWLYLGDEYFRQELIIDMVPICGVAVPITHPTGADETFGALGCSVGQTIPFIIPPWVNFTIPQSNMTFNNLSGIVDAVTQTVCWNVEVTVTGNAAEHVYFYFGQSSTGHLAITSVTDQNSQLLQTHNAGVFEAGTLSPGTYQFTICGTYTCQGAGATETLDLNYGWNCGSYPTGPPDPTICSVNTGTIGVRESPASLIFDNIINPTTYAACVPQQFSVCVRSSDIGGIHNFAYLLRVPPHLTLGNVQFNFYPSTYTGNCTFPPASASTSIPAPTSWHFPPHVFPNNSNDDIYLWGLPNTGNYGTNEMLENGEILQISYTITPDCIYNGAMPVLWVHGDNYCGNHILMVPNFTPWSHNAAADACIPQCIHTCHANFSFQIASTTCTFFAFTNTSTPQPPNVLYLWDFGDGSTSTLQHPTHDFVGPQTYIVCLSIATVDSTGDTLCVDRRCRTLVVNNPVITLTSTLVNCNSHDITATITGGIGPTFSYFWTPNIGSGITNSRTFTTHHVAAGTYTLTIEDYEGCRASATITIVNPSLLTMSITYDPILCHGDLTTVHITASGGTPPYSGIGDFPGYAAGSYLFSISDAVQCQAFGIITIPQPTEMQAQVSVTNPGCHGDCGEVDIHVTGGTPPYSGDGHYNCVLPGSYSFVVKDAKNCIILVPVTVTDPPAINVTTTLNQCNPLTSVDVKVTGGVAGYQYQWIPGPSGFSATGIFTTPGFAPGTYTLIITDANGCVFTKIVNIDSPPLPLTVSITQGNCCDGQATLRANASGGIGPYSYRWFNAANQLISSTQTTQLLSNGTYHVEVKDSRGCVVTQFVTINCPTFWITVESTPIICYGQQSTVTVTGHGGTPPYIGDEVYSIPAGTWTLTATDAEGLEASYTITIEQPYKLNINVASGTISCNGGTTTVTVSAYDGTPPYSGTGTFTVGPGTHSFTVTDANGCTKSQSITLANPNPLFASVTNNKPIACYGGTTSLIVTIANGVPPYTYQWSPTGGSGTVNGSFTTSGFADGTYTVTITDNNGCVRTATRTLIQPPLYTANAGNAQTTCAGTSVTLAGTIGTGATSSTWSAPSGTFSNPASLNSTYTPGISSGTVLLTLTANNPLKTCAAVTSTVVITVIPPASANAGSGQSVCAGGTITLAGTITGATSSTWSAPSGTFSNPASLTSTYTPSISSGNVTLTLTTNDPDGAGPCVAGTSTVIITVTAPPTPANAGSAQTICTEFSATLAANIPVVGTGTWSVVSGPSLLISQFSNTSSAASTFTPIGGVGNYILKWTISNAPCTPSSSNVTITVNGPPTNANAGVAQTICVTTSATLAANLPTSGTGAWSVVSGPSLLISQFSNASSPTSTFTPAGGAGNYVLRWTITNSPCTQSTSNVTVTVKLQPTVANAGSAQTFCNTTSSVTLAANLPTIGTGTWSVVSGPSLLLNQFSNISSTSSTFTPGGGAGSYVLRWTITNPPCQSYSDVIIKVNLINLSAVVTDESNRGAHDGKIIVSASGGSSPYTFLWSTGATTGTIGHLPAGHYCLTVSDAINCTTQNCWDVRGFIIIHEDEIFYVVRNGSTISPSNSTIAYSIIPNPSSGNFELVVNSPDDTSLQSELVDYFGQVIQAKTLNVSKGVNSFSYSLNNQSKGVYMLRLNNERSSRLLKVVVQ